MQHIDRYTCTKKRVGRGCDVWMGPGTVGPSISGVFHVTSPCWQSLSLTDWQTHLPTYSRSVRGPILWSSHTHSESSSSSVITTAACALHYLAVLFVPAQRKWKCFSCITYTKVVVLLVNPQHFKGCPGKQEPVIFGLFTFSEPSHLCIFPQLEYESAALVFMQPSLPGLTQTVKLCSLVPSKWPPWLGHLLCCRETCLSSSRHFDIWLEEMFCCSSAPVCSSAATQMQICCQILTMKMGTKEIWF